MTAGSECSKSNSAAAFSRHDQLAGPSLVLNAITAPRFRRYLVVYVFLLFICCAVWTKFHEEQVLFMALDVQGKNAAGSRFGSNSLPKFSDMIHLRTLDPSLLPGDQPLSKGHPYGKRLVVVGDVHGCKDECKPTPDQLD
jgi:hypothetical protein